MKPGQRMIRRGRSASADREPALHATASQRGFRLSISNHQRTRPLNVSALRQIGAALLQERLKIEKGELGIHLVAAPKMTQLNEKFLQHQGSTDVIAFDYATVPAPDAIICGEIFVCVDEAVLQARRFRTTWQSEVVRYVIHGTLHLLGHDDHDTTARRAMKREENRLLRSLAACFPLSHLGRKPKLPG